MNSNSDSDLRFFTRDFIRTYGGAVEDLGRGMDAVLPPELAERLAVSEYINVRFVSDGPGEGKIHYGSPLLDAMVGVARERVPVTSCILHFDYLKTAGFDRLIGELFIFGNATIKVEKTAETVNDYIFLYCHYLAQSDEQKEGLIPLAYNRNTLVDVSAMTDAMTGIDMDFGERAAAIALSGGELREIENLVHGSATAVLAEELRDFEASMNRRYRRDVKNLGEYYGALEREMKNSLARGGQSEQLIAERREKMALLPAELAAKTEDLYKKYSISISLRLGGAMLLRSPVVMVLLRVSVGRKKENIQLHYNPVLKTIEPLRCENCRQATYRPFFGEKMQVFCPQCA